MFAGVNATNPETKPPGNLMITRRRALGLLTTGAAACLANAAGVEPGLLSVTRETIACDKLSGGLQGLRIGLLADFHFRPGQDDRLLEKVVAQVRRERLDLIALSGDFVSDDPAMIRPLLEHLKQLEATHGIFAVPGNHDGWSGSHADLRRQFEAAGISFLINQHSQLSIRGESIAIAGTDYVWRGNPEPAKTLRGIAAATPVLALVHEPDYFDTMTAHREILLQVSGHTHGGQCRVPWIGYAPMKVAYGRKYVYGGYARDGSNLFVTRGVGTVGPRVRFACPPELAILTLAAKES
jgi:predicted MPP superfamily phosphohydrolase